MPTYTGLKDFARGVQKLYKQYGNIPVFVCVDNGLFAPFGIALVSETAYIDGQETIAFCGHRTREGLYDKGEVT